MDLFELFAAGVLIVSVGLLIVGFRMVGKKPGPNPQRDRLRSFWSGICKVMGTLGLVETLAYLVVAIAGAWIES